eukprot:m51a1_g8399 putative OsmC-like protein (174) ;mRNA; r:228970-229554
MESQQKQTEQLDHCAAPRCCAGGARITAEYTGTPVRVVASHSDTPDATITTDAPVRFGGSGRGMSPVELVVTGLACCLETILVGRLLSAGAELPAGSLRITASSRLTPKGVTPVRVAKIALTVSFAVELSEGQRQVAVDTAQLSPVRKSLSEDVEVAAQFVWADGSSVATLMH